MFHVEHFLANERWWATSYKLAPAEVRAARAVMGVGVINFAKV